MSSPTSPVCKQLVLDAGPLLSLSPLRGLAETYVTVPQVLGELKDRRAREHFERLALTAGVDVKVQSPDAAALAHVVQFAKKTGDYSVLSQADLAILALTYALDVQAKADAAKEKESGTAVPVATSDASTSQNTTVSIVKSSSNDDSVEPAAEVPPPSDAEEDSDHDESEDVCLPEEQDDAQEDINDDIVADEGDLAEREPLDVELHLVPKEQGLEPSLEHTTSASSSLPQSANEPLFSDPDNEDDGEGEWITPSNVALHKSKALGFTPSAADSKSKRIAQSLPVGCMTVDFAMQNVLLQMGLNLVGVEGKRIEKVKTWVLRCHACFKICKDNSKKFCPSCGNPTLLRTSVTVSGPSASGAPGMKVHLKKNFQYRTRGTIYSIPAPKAGSAKTGSGEGLILREDQLEYMRAVKRTEAKKQRDEKRMLSTGAAAIGNWMDPDWVPDILTASAGGKGRRTGRGDDLPVIGYGRRNPNERKHHKK